jgi:hypothetical protein
MPVNNYHNISQLFDRNLVYEMIAVGILIYMTEELKIKDYDEEAVAKYVVDHFNQILQTIIDENEKDVSE